MEEEKEVTKRKQEGRDGQKEEKGEQGGGETLLMTLQQDGKTPKQSQKHEVKLIKSLYCYSAGRTKSPSDKIQMKREKKCLYVQ